MKHRPRKGLRNFGITWGALLAALFFSAAPGALGSPQETAAGTLPNPNNRSPLPSFLKPVENLFTAKPCHLLVQSVVPGGGIGGGGRCTKDFSRDPWKREFRATGAITIRQFWTAGLQLRIAHDAFTPWHSAQGDFVMHFYLRTRDLPRMAFYGIGPDSKLSDQVFFSERDTLAGVTLTDPLVSWFDVGGRLESLWPMVGGADPRSQSIGTRFTDTTAPGLSSQPNLLHYELYLRPHLGAQPPFNLDYRISYGYYQDHHTGQFSFRRLEFDLRNTLFPERWITHTKSRDGYLELHGLISASDASSGHAVPFFLQRTLGGTNPDVPFYYPALKDQAGMDMAATLRGFKDFRFRAPNDILFQAEYDRRIWKYLGGLAFYDAGKSVLRKSDLTLANLRQSYGFGLAVFLEDKVVFRAYVGLGGGEGTHPYFGLASFTGE